MNNKVFVVTGAGSGVGKAIALALAKTGGTVVMVARDEERGAQAHKEIITTAENDKVDLQLCDLGTMSSVRNLATIITHRYEKIDALVNTVSVYRDNRQLTVDGYETMFATNHLGPFLLTYLLLNSLMAAEAGRIVNLTASATETLNFDDLNGEEQFKPLRTFNATRMANLLFTYELARRMQGTRVTVNALDPGSVRSEATKGLFAPFRWLSLLISSSPARVGEEIANWVSAPENGNINGKFLHEGKELAPPAYALDPAMQAKLWEVSEQLAILPVSEQDH